MKMSEFTCQMYVRKYHSVPWCVCIRWRRQAKSTKKELARLGRVWISMQTSVVLASGTRQVRREDVAREGGE